MLEDILQIGQKRFSSLGKLKIQFHGHVLLVIQMVKKLLELFMRKNYKTEVDKLDIDKLVPVPVDLSKLNK